MAAFRFFHLTLLFILTVTFTLTHYPTHAENLTWTTSRWGPTDEIGAANYITARSVLQASKLIKTGKTYPLGIVVDSTTPTFQPRTLQLTVLQPFNVGEQQVTGVFSNGLTGNDDVLYAWLGTGTQIDGLGHVGVRGVYYNGFRDVDFVRTTGLLKMGVEKIPPLVGRAVVLDMARYYGEDIVNNTRAYRRRDIKRVARRQKTAIRKGDIILFHSNWLRLLDGTAEDRARFIAVQPGLSVSGARYLARKGVVAIGADTPTMEIAPGESETELAVVHQILLAMNGIYILESVNVTGLVADGRLEFLFVLGAARVRGAVQMIINPIGIA